MSWHTSWIQTLGETGQWCNLGSMTTNTVGIAVWIVGARLWVHPSWISTKKCSLCILIPFKKTNNAYLSPPAAVRWLEGGPWMAGASHDGAGAPHCWAAGAFHCCGAGAFHCWAAGALHCWAFHWPSSSHWFCWAGCWLWSAALSQFGYAGHRDGSTPAGYCAACWCWAYTAEMQAIKQIYMRVKWSFRFFFIKA